MSKNNGFTQTSASQIRDGSAVNIDTTVIFSATSNTFKNLVSGNGAVSLIDNESSVDLSILFPSLASSSTKLVTFSSNTFTGCKSYGTVGGGAVYYAWTLSGCQLSFSGDSFIAWTSAVNGGAILWTYSQPNGVDTCTFSNNIAAIYGNNVAAIPTKIMVIPGTSYSNMIISNQRSGGSLPLLKIGVYDVYGQIVASLNDGTLTSTITWNTKDTYPSFVTEPDTLKSTSGIFSFNNVVTTGTPGVTQKITFKTSSINEKIPVNKAYLTSNSLSSSEITFTVNLRYWIAGEEFLSDGAWSTWAAGVGYSMVAPTTISSCTPCPVSYAYWLGGNSIAPKAGYWRPDISSDLFLQWQTTSAWLGYTSANNNFYGGCSEGYIGVLWGDWDYGYSRTNDFEWGKCPNTIYNGLRIFGFIILMIVVLLFLVKTTLNGAGNKRNALGVYNRIIVNHVQMVTIIYSFKLEWPSTFTDIFKSTKTASDVTQQFISFDCFIDRRTSTDMNANPIPLYYYRLFLMAALPLIIMIINSIIWNIIFLYYTYKETPESRLNTANYRKMLGNQKERRIIATNFIVLLFIHPSILNVYFQMFSWTKINGVSRLNQELATEWYTGLHLYLSLFVASPAIIIWGFGIPLYAIGKLYFSRKVLERDETREEIGYLYNGYSELSYYWEPIIIIRKIVLVACASLFTSLGRKVQAMLIFIFLLFVILLQSHK